MPIQDLQVAIDAKLNKVEKDLINAQTNYKITKGIYFQGLKTHSSVPVDGVESSPDKLDQKPAKKTDKWSDFINLPSKVAANLEIHEYKGPEGDGYIVVITAMLEGELYSRSINVGPLTGETKGWTRYARSD